MVHRQIFFFPFLLSCGYLSVNFQYAQHQMAMVKNEDAEKIHHIHYP